MPVDWSQQRWWEDLEAGQEIPAVAFPITVARLVLEAGGNRDFHPLHHNDHYARSTGAPDMYANNMFLQGMWERTVREFIGLGGTIRRLSGFRMRRFNHPGDTAVVKGRVLRTWLDNDEGFADLEVETMTSVGTTVGPGVMTVTVPRRPPT